MSDFNGGYKCSLCFSDPSKEPSGTSVVEDPASSWRRFTERAVGVCNDALEVSDPENLSLSYNVVDLGANPLDNTDLSVMLFRYGEEGIRLTKCEVASEWDSLGCLMNRAARGGEMVFAFKFSETYSSGVEGDSDFLIGSGD